MSHHFVVAAAVFFAVATHLPADVLIPTVPVGDPGNAADNTGYGSVAQPYRIGTYEVTTGQYTAFLNAVAQTDTYGLYNPAMGDPIGELGCNIQRSGSPGSYTYRVATQETEPEWANRPVNYVSFWDAARFANWLQNGQPGLTTPVPQDANSTERGTYTLDGYTGSDGRTISRNAGAIWFIPSENEWYKGAYFDPSKSGGAGYWDYPTKTDDPSPPVAEVPPGRSEPPGSANYNNVGDGTHSLTEVGAYSQSGSPYGTFDQGGNVWEWNESLMSAPERGLRGGSHGDVPSQLQASSRHPGYYPYITYEHIGFRVGSTPEPGGIAMLVSGTAALFIWWRRRNGRPSML